MGFSRDPQVDSLGILKGSYVDPKVILWVSLKDHQGIINGFCKDPQRDSLGILKGSSSGSLVIIKGFYVDPKGILK